MLHALGLQMRPMPVLPGAVLGLISHHPGVALCRCEFPVPVHPGGVLLAVLIRLFGMRRRGDDPESGERSEEKPPHRFHLSKVTGRLLAMTTAGQPFTPSPAARNAGVCPEVSISHRLLDRA
jgi:hypothetical protein